MSAQFDTNVFQAFKFRKTVTTIAAAGLKSTESNPSSAPLAASAAGSKAATRDVSAGNRSAFPCAVLRTEDSKAEQDSLADRPTCTAPVLTPRISDITAGCKTEPPSPPEAAADRFASTSTAATAAVDAFAPSDVVDVPLLLSGTAKGRQKRKVQPGTDGVGSQVAGAAWGLKTLRSLGSLEDSPGVPELLGDWPLRLIIVGHNPSEHAWRTGHYYSNPGNWMWRLLRETGIAPPEVQGAQDDRSMPALAGVGFVDVGCGTPGTNHSDFTSHNFQQWAAPFYSRLQDQAARAARNAGCSCGRCGAPCIVAFSGKRQYAELLNLGLKGRAKITDIPLGKQSRLPEHWPLPSSTEVRVLTSTSGASALTNAARLAPYAELAERLRGIPWPRQVACRQGQAET